MIISVKTTDPLDAGPVNLYSKWDMMDFGRMIQRTFINISISGYWNVNKDGFMKKILLLGNTTPDISFVLDMRIMDIGALYDMYQKVKNTQYKKEVQYYLSKESVSVIANSDKTKHEIKTLHLDLIQLK